MRYFQTNKTAFTLVELLVSISVLGLIAAVSVTSYPKFSDQLGVTSETYKMLAYLRQAQVYGVSGYTSPGVKVVYGVEINKDTGTLNVVQWENPDSTTNHDYIDEVRASTEPLLTINNKYIIDRICDDTGCDVNSVSTNNFTKGFVLFRRPNPEARLLALSGNDSGNIKYPTDPASSVGFQRMEIVLKSKKNEQFMKKVVILQTGQMYVNDW